jgi:NAD(P)H dehydrogenase (quinone)
VFTYRFAYPGIEALPPFVLYGTDRMTRAAYQDAAKVWEQRMLTLESTEPIAFQRQNLGDYEISSPRLKRGLEPAGRAGFGLHLRGRPPASWRQAS